MFNANNVNNGNASQNIWDQMALFNQLTLRNILNGRNNLGTPELRAAMVAMLDEQRDNTLVFLECSTEEQAGLPDGCGIQAIANVRNLLDYLPTIAIFIIFRHGCLSKIQTDVGNSYVLDAVFRFCHSFGL